MLNPLEKKYDFKVILLFSLILFGLSFIPLRADNSQSSGSRFENSNDSSDYQWTRHRRRENRKVYIQVEIYPDGGVKSAKIYKSSGYPDLDETALFSAKQWKFSSKKAGDQSIRKKIICVRFASSMNPRSSSDHHAVSKKTWVSYILADVSHTGHVKSVRLYKSSGDQGLDSMALNAVRRWKLHPARKGNTPIASQVIIPVQFHIKHYPKKQLSLSVQGQQ
ncbi:energy transducer TonB [Methylacidiphilum caldifontis]|uniref:energy transducer TonB n=1 Tax=Methylacidiphilum caldifontis TaxID=2795386 RepID=UPI001FC8F740|nr:energy transducer TonB [Methylacidiphilum caldifontis]